MWLKFKAWFQSTFLYTIYLFFVRNFRRLKNTALKIRSKFRKLTNPIYMYLTLGRLYPHIYKKYAKLPVDERKVVFVENRLPKLTNSFKVMYDTIFINYDLDVHCHFLRNVFAGRTEYRKRCKAMVKDVATAKYVFFAEATNVIGRIDFRPETVVTQLWHGCGAFKKFGFSTADAIFGSSRETMEKYPFYRNYTNVTVSSPEVIWAYEEAMNYSHESGVVKALGSSRTDVFYDKSFIDDAYTALYEIMPRAEGKKVILYAPTFRGRVAAASAPRILNIEMMQYELGEEYVLLIKHHPLVKKRPAVPEYCNDFALDVTDTLTIEELLCVSDVCISDYSSLVFEYSLFEKPMLFLAHDIDSFFDWRGFYYDYYELAPGPVVKDTGELLDYMRDIDKNFDKQRVADFRKKFMSACDGHATERILDAMLTAEAQKKYKRETPLEKKKYHLIPSFEDYKI